MSVDALLQICVELGIWKSPEAKPLIQKQSLPVNLMQFGPVDRVETEVNNLLAGRSYDANVLNTNDPVARQSVASLLLGALAGHNRSRQERAKQAFMDHGYFDETTKQLQAADSPAERAAAARMLGVANDAKATVYLTASLRDSAPEVRRAAVESLGQLGDPSAIGDLNELLLRENSRQLPEAVIRHAINAIAVSGKVGPTASGHGELPVEKFETHDVFSEYLSAVEPLRPSNEETLVAEEEALRQAAEALERKRLEAEVSRRLAEDEARFESEKEAAMKAEFETRVLAEAEARHLAAEVAARQKAEEEVRPRMELEARQRAEEEARVLAEEEARFRLEAETLRKAAEELSRKRAEAETARRLAEEEARGREEAEAKLSAEEEARARAIEEARLRAEPEDRHRVEEGMRPREEEEARLRAEAEAQTWAAVEARIRREIEAHFKAEEAAKLRAEGEAKRRIEEESRLRHAMEAQRRADEELVRREAEERRRLEDERLHLEHETLMQVAAELSRRRSELEGARERAEAEARLLVEAQERAKAEDEKRRQLEAERQRTELEAKRKAEAEYLMELQSAAEEELRLAQEHARQAQEAEQRLAGLELLRRKAFEEAALRTEREQRLKAEILALSQAEEEQRQRIEAESRTRAEAESDLKEREAQAEEEARLRAETEARLQEEASTLEAQKEAHRRIEEEANRLVEEARARSQEESARRAEAEAHRQSGESSLDAFAFESHSAPDTAPELTWVDVNIEDRSAEMTASLADEEHTLLEGEMPSPEGAHEEMPAKAVDVAFAEKGIAPAEGEDAIPADVLKRLSSEDPSERGAALMEISRIGGDNAFSCISRSFDDPITEVRNTAARALFDLQPDRVAAFTRALREGTPERRRKIGQALAGSGLAKDSVGNLTGESSEKTYDAFSLLFLMAKAGEVQSLLQAIEDYPNVEVRVAVVKLLALSGQPEIVPAFRRLAVRGSLPSEVRSAVMESIYQISNQARQSATSAA